MSAVSRPAGRSITGRLFAKDSNQYVSGHNNPHVSNASLAPCMITNMLADIMTNMLADIMTHMLENMTNMLATSRVFASLRSSTSRLPSSGILTNMQADIIPNMFVKYNK